MEKIEPEKISYEDFQSAWLQPMLPIRDLLDLKGGPLYRCLPFWRRKGLLPFVDNGDWNVEISFSQLIWMRIIEHLRQLGYSIADIGKLTDRLFRDAYYFNLHMKKLREMETRLIALLKQGKISDDDRLLLHEIERVIQDPLLQYSLKMEFNYLTDLIGWSLSHFNEEAALLIFPEGNVMVKRGEEPASPLEQPETKIPEAGAGNSKAVNPRIPHIYLSVRNMLSEFIENSEMEGKILPSLMNENEKQVLREMRKKNIRQIIIKMKEGEPFRIDVQEEKEISDIKAREIRRILGMHNYEEVTISTIDEKTVSFKKTKKNMLSG